MKENIICDLDGTLANDEHRAVHLHPEETRDWEKYFSLCHLDAPHVAAIEVLNVFYETHMYNITILSGRSMSTAEKTYEWLKKHKVKHNYLQMRGVDDRTQDDVLKLRWAKELGLGPKNTLFVLEDRQRVVDAWRKAGYTVFQVAPGKF